MDFPLETLEDILARLPLKSIARIRSVSKEWKSVIDSDYFRDKFISLHSSSSVAWSIIQMQPHKLTLEIVGHRGCETWGLTRSPGSLVRFFVKNPIKKLLVLACTDGLVLIYAEDRDDTSMYFVGNPLTKECFRIPLPRFRSLHLFRKLQKYDRFSDAGLVTKMQSGIVVSYKVVWWISRPNETVGFKIYSSDTGMWESRASVTCLLSDFWFDSHKPIALNGFLHWFSDIDTSFIAYDFYGDPNQDDECRIVKFPDSGKGYESPCFRRTLSTSQGSIVYFNGYYDNGNRTLRVWRLLKYTDGPDAWQLFREVSLLSLVELGSHYYFPVVMHPLNSEIIYLWSRSVKGMILLNLRTHELSVHRETASEIRCMDGCILSFNSCSEYMSRPIQVHGPHHQLFSQYVLPRWLHRLPRTQPT